MHTITITLQSTRFALRATCTTTPMQSYYQTVEIPTEATLVEKVARMTLPFGRGVVTAIYFFNIIVGYLLMLFAMTFDVGLFFAASMGIALGHLIGCCTKGNLICTRTRSRTRPCSCILK